MTYPNATDTSRQARHEVDETTAGSHPALADKPRLTNPYFLLIKELQRGIGQAISALALTERSRILDYGCSTMRYRQLFPVGADYVGADLPGNELADVVLDPDGRVPQPSDSFDVVFSTQVLEHVDDPALYLQECRRVLKPGGRLVLSTHGTFVFHPCPSDYWRWTEMGLEKTLKNAGFSVVSAQGLLGGVAAALQFLQDETARKLPRFIRPLYYAFMQTLIVLGDRLYSPAQRKKNACILLMTAEA